ncbi:hypothetical protein C0991_000746 [Blastosporella zonata]|nr:hypothetical protein C0991_000746 [Blastosporella zonata]
MSEDHPQLRLTDRHGIDVALQLIATYPPRSITYIALGPLTNLATMVQKNNALIRQRIGRVICMGGALDVPGNTSPVADTGELTRGMLVVDKREDESAYSPGANRAEIQAEMDKKSIQHGIWESSALPAQVETEEDTKAQPKPSGILCVTETPGPDALLSLLFRRVWGVET